MAIANSDGSVVLTTKIDVSGVSKGIDALKVKFKSLKDQRAAIQTLTTAIRDQQTAIKQLEMQYALLVAKGNGNTAQAETLREQIKMLKTELTQLQGAAAAAGAETATSFSKVATAAKRFGKRIAGILKSALIFSVIYKVLQSVLKLFKNILMSDKEFKQDWEELKAAFYTAAYPIINLIVPAIKWIVWQVRDWAISIGKIAALLQGMTYSELVDQAKASKEAADNYEDMERNSKKTADNVKKQLAGFDDIQTLSPNDTSENEAQSKAFEGLKSDEVGKAKSTLGDLVNAVSGALMAIGVLLLLNGQVAWGIGFIIAGAATVDAVMAQSKGTRFEKDIIRTLTVMMGIIGGALIALGVILLWIGGVVGMGVAIGMIIAGAAMIVNAVASQTAFSANDIQGWLTIIMGIAGGALLALGIILCMVGSIPLGVGMIIAGAVSLVSAIAINSNAIIQAVEGPLGIILAIAGSALLALGIILTCAGNFMLGIPLIAIGAASLATTIAVNWNKIVEALQGPIGAIIALVGGALLVLGIILTCCGILPLGIALIAVGAASLVTVTALNWNKIVEWVKGAWEAVKDFWNKYIAPVFTVNFWLDLANTCGNGLISGFEAAINGIISMFEKMINWIVDGLNNISFDIPEWLGGGTFGFNLERVNFGRVKIPRLAQGSVLPGGKPFLAMVNDQPAGQTNIEAPLQTIVDAFNIALAQNGGGGNTTVVLEVDGREFGRAVVEQGNKESRRIGTRLVIA